jgi:hypothetical protein
MDASGLPANFASTANALELLAFSANDALLVVDDFAPTGGPVPTANSICRRKRLAHSACQTGCPGHASSEQGRSTRRDFAIEGRDVVSGSKNWRSCPG